MPFRSGSVAYARFRVESAGGSAPPEDVSQTLLTALAEHTLQPTEVGEPPAIEFGWCGGRHVYDEVFSAENNAFGRTLLFALRIDTNKVPADVKRAYRSMAESGYAADSATGFLSRRERAAAKEDAEERCRQELASGKHRKSKMVEIIWDLERRLVLAPIFSDAHVAGLRDLFFTTFDLRLQPVSAGALAFDLLSRQGRMRDYENLFPSAYTPAPAQYAEGDRAEAFDGSRPPVPWAHTTAEASDFIGNEFLLWLWWKCAAEEGEFDAGDRRFGVVLERTLDMECAWDVSGKLAMQNGIMTRAPEALRALQIGKWPRKMGLTLGSAGEAWQATLQGDRFLVSGLKIDRPQEEVRSQRDLVEHRLNSLARVDEMLTDLFGEFLAERAESGWETRRRAISEWIAGRRPPRAALSIAEPKQVGHEVSLATTEI